jgi:hypothetical protein
MPQETNVNVTTALAISTMSQDAFEEAREQLDRIQRLPLTEELFLGDNDQLHERIARMQDLVAKRESKPVSKPRRLPSS